MTIELEWEDTREVRLGLMMGLGYEFDHWEHYREEVASPIGRFAVWMFDSDSWAYYGGDMGYFERGFLRKADAQHAVRVLAGYDPT